MKKASRHGVMKCLGLFPIQRGAPDFCYFYKKCSKMYLYQENPYLPYMGCIQLFLTLAYTKTNKATLNFIRKRLPCVRYGAVAS